MEHPITLPPELVQQWAISSPIQCSDESWAYELFIAHQAARWGADQELEACCEWTRQDSSPEDAASLRAARRPKPPSLKEQALDALQSMRISPKLIAIINANTDLKDKYETIRRALEQLND